jgi:hypothetical protein
MDNNPLKDITEKLRQQNVEQRLQTIETDIKVLKGAEKMKLIELEVTRECGPYNIKKTISLNPACITFIEGEDDNHCYIHTNDKTVLHVLKSRDEVLKLFNEESGQSYIK